MPTSTRTPRARTTRWRARTVAVAVALATAVGGASGPGGAAAAPTGPAATVPLQVGPEKGFPGVPAGVAQFDPAVAWNGSVFVVAWAQPTTDDHAVVRASRVTVTGKVLDPAGVVVGFTSDYASHVAAASGAGGVLLVWQDDIPETYNDLVAAMVSGGTSGPLTVEKRWGLSGADNQQDDPSVAWSGDLFMTAFADLYNNTDGQSITGVRVLRNGLTLDGCSSDACAGVDYSGLDLASPGIEPDLRDPAIAWSTAGEGQFLTVWVDRTDPANPDLSMGRIQLTGYAIDGDGLPLSRAAGEQSQPALAANGPKVMSLWTDRRSGTPVVYGALVSRLDGFSTPVVGPQHPLAAASGQQSEPVAVASGTGYLAAWTDTRSGTSDVYAARLGPKGYSTDGAGVPVAGSAGAERSPAVARSFGGKSLVVYESVATSGPNAGVSRVVFRLVS